MVNCLTDCLACVTLRCFVKLYNCVVVLVLELFILFGLRAVMCLLMVVMFVFDTLVFV